MEEKGEGGGAHDVHDTTEKVGPTCRGVVRTAEVENGRKQYYNVENGSSRFGIFLYFSN